MGKWVFLLIIQIEFQQIIEGMAASSLRCIAFAHANYAHEDSNGQLKKDGLVLLGLMVLKVHAILGPRKQWTFACPPELKSR